VGLLSGILKYALIRTVRSVYSTSLWCVPVCNSALADLLEGLSRNARSSRTPCLDVLPRIHVVLKNPEGSAANHCQIQDLWPPQRNEVPYAGAGMRWPDLSSSRNRKDQIEASDCRERSLAWKRGNEETATNSSSGSSASWGPRGKARRTRAAVVRWLGKPSTGPVWARL
jgi:hypothetical protein